MQDPALFIPNTTKGSLLWHSDAVECAAGCPCTWHRSVAGVNGDILLFVQLKNDLMLSINFADM